MRKARIESSFRHRSMAPSPGNAARSHRQRDAGHAPLPRAVAFVLSPSSAGRLTPDIQFYEVHAVGVD